ncbi:MAG TPA: hypothetical protein VE988_23695 [Gemmataceae bacterium]|nr:hypothetical protein [Gemmataceae bacterium]
MIANKGQVLRMIARLPEDVTYDRVLYHLDVLNGINIGMDEVERGEGIEHDELFNRLMAEDAQEEAEVDAGRRARSAGNKGPHSPASAKNGRGLHKTPQKLRRQKTAPVI